MSRLDPAVLGRGLRGVAPLIGALLVGAAVLAVSGRNPISTYHLYGTQAFGSWPQLANTFAAATPILLTGVGTALAFRAGFFNVGLEGAVYTGALGCAWAGVEWTALPGPLLAVCALIFAMAIGALWLLLPALLRAWLAIDEVVTLMLNYVAISLTTFLVLQYFLASTIGNAQSPAIASKALLPALTSGTSLTIGAIVAVIVLAAYGWFLKRTRLGTEIRMVGDNPSFAAAMGFSVRRAVMLTMLAGGALGGLAGGFVMLGVTGNFTAGFSTSPGYGYTGIAVAVLGRNSWPGLLLAALFFGALSSAGGVVQLFGDVPIALTQILQGMMMIFAGVQLVRNRRSRRRARTTPAAAAREGIAA